MRILPLAKQIQKLDNYDRLRSHIGWRTDLFTHRDWRKVCARRRPTCDAVSAWVGRLYGSDDSPALAMVLGRKDANPHMLHPGATLPLLAVLRFWPRFSDS